MRNLSTPNFKIVFSFIIFSLFNVCVYSQAILEKGKIWKYFELNWHTGELSPSFYTLGNDTMVNNMKYTVLLENFNSIEGPWYKTNVILREEDLRVYKIENGEEEQILYDFTLSESDTLNVNNTCRISFLSSGNYVFADSSSVPITTLFFRTENNSHGGFSWGRGIGNLDFPFHYSIHDICNDFLPLVSFGCLYQDNTLIIDGVSAEGYCNDLTTSNTEVEFENQVKVFPNPTDSYVIIETGTNNSRLQQVQIYTLNAELVKTIKDIESKTIQIDIPEILSQSFILHALLENGNSFSKIIMKQY